MNTLIIIDMQNDFITGSLANKDAQAIVAPICNFIKNFDGNIIFTRDTHGEFYLDTPEGKALPIKHCVYGTQGWEIDKTIFNTAKEANKDIKCIDKATFGYTGWKDPMNMGSIGDTIILCGTCTDICVVSNALILKAQYPDKKVIVLKDLCAGLTKEKHDAALNVMASCQIEVK